MAQYGKRSAKKSGGEGIVLSRRLVQLMVCLGLFTAVYVTKGVFPHKIQRLSENITTLVGTTADLQAAFSGLGDAISSGDSIVDELGTFCIEVFGGTIQETVEDEVDYSILVSNSQAISTTQLFQSSWSGEGDQWTEDASLEEAMPSEVVAEEEAVMTVGQVYLEAEEDLRALPAGYTYDMLYLGDLEWTTPVLGEMSSTFGYRIHPLSGDDSIHNGVDLVGEVGDPIYAFADGVIEYIGESDVYGLYFRIDHGNGVKTFYAHCSQLLVSKGDTVEMGEVVALVGATGNVTGSHLHFEMLCNDILIDPTFYIDIL